MDADARRKKEQLRKTFRKLKREIIRAEFPTSLAPIHEKFRLLAKNNFFVPSETWLNPSELASFTKLLVLYARDVSRHPWVDLARPLNVYKQFWQHAEEANQYAQQDEYLGTFILRFVFQQVPFLVYPERVQQLLGRTTALYSAPPQATGGFDIAQKLGESAGIAIDVLLRIAKTLYDLFKVRVDLTEAELLKSQTDSDRQYLKQFMNLASANRRQFERLYRTRAAADLEESPYEINPLLRYPILDGDSKYWAPFPELIIYAATRGLFFEMLDRFKNAFAEAFGPSFEAYAGALAKGYWGKAGVLTEEDERTIGLVGKTNDFTILGQSRAVLFECKTSALFLSSKKHASVSELRDDIRKNLVNPEKGKGLIQLFRKVESIVRGDLPPIVKARYGSIKKFFPVLLLYDQIQLANVPQVLGNLLRAELQRCGIGDGFDFQIWHIEELENLFELVPRDEFLSVVESKFEDPAKKALDLNTYLYELKRREYLRPHMWIPGGDTKASQTLGYLAAASHQDE